MRSKPTASTDVDLNQLKKAKFCSDCKHSISQGIGNIPRTSYKSVASNNSIESVRSDLSQILEHSQRLIFKYPDGTFSYAYKCSKAGSANRKDPEAHDGKDTWLQVKSNQNSSNPGQLRIPLNVESADNQLSEFQVI